MDEAGRDGPTPAQVSFLGLYFLEVYGCLFLSTPTSGELLTSIFPEGDSFRDQTERRPQAPVGQLE